MTDVSIIIVNYNTCKLTVKCIDSICEKTIGISYEIIMVDNASTDKSVECIKKAYPFIKIIENKENLGFGKANNLGVEMADGKYIFLLNSDTILLNNAPKLFFDFCELNNLRKVVVGSELYNTSNEIIHSYNRFPTMLSVLFEPVLRRYKSRTIQAEYPINVDYVTGADLFMQKKLFQDIGGFDKNIFLYYEETDLQKRMSEIGVERLIINTPRIVHLVGGSNERENKVSLTEIFSIQSQHYYFKKHYNRLYYIIYRFSFFFFRIPVIFKRKLSYADTKKLLLALLYRVRC